MTIALEFDYAKPESLEAALGLLAEHGGRAKLLAGGTDVVCWLRDELVEPDLLIDLKGIPGLKALAVDDGTLSLGALTTFSDLVESDTVREALPVLWEAARTVASVGIRNRATIVGNICSAVPSCDAGPVLLVCEAVVTAVGPGGERRIPMAEWFTGPKKTVLGDNEIVTRIDVPLPEGPSGGAYVKLGRYRGEDLAQAGVAVLALHGNRYRVAFGAVAPTPVRAPAIEAVLEGKPIDERTVAAARALVPTETAPIADIRASREYRVHMLPIMLERGLRAAAARRGGGGPAYGTALIEEAP